MFNIVWTSLYVITFCILLNVLANGGLNSRSWLVVVAALLPATSPLWSALPSQSLVQGVGLAANIAFAVILARRFSLARIITQARWAINTMLILSLIAVVIRYPGAFYNDGLQRDSILGMPPLQGLFTHKIFLGVYSAIGLGLNLNTLRGVRRIGFAGLSFFFALSSGSSTSLVALAIVLFLTLDVSAARRTNLGGVFNLPVLFFVLATSTIAVTQYDEILSALGRDTSLTGRTELWHWAIVFFEQKPILGWGYGGIFNDNSTGPSDIFFNGVYRAPHFHSGYLQVLAELGGIGFFLTMIVLVSVIVRVYKSAFHSYAPDAVALLVTFGTLIPVYFVMNILMRYNDFSTILLVTTFLAQANPNGEKNSALLSNSMRPSVRNNSSPAQYLAT